MATIVRDTAGLLYVVRDAGADLSHVWIGTPCRKDGTAKAGAKERLVRRAGCTLFATPIANGPRA